MNQECNDQWNAYKYRQSEKALYYVDENREKNTVLRQILVIFETYINNDTYTHRFGKAEIETLYQGIPLRDENENDNWQEKEIPFPLLNVESLWF